MNKHYEWELKQYQCLSLESKIRLTNERIKGWINEYDGNAYVSRSGGKDSDVLGDLVKKYDSSIPQVFVNTGLEWDSVRKHGIEIADEVLYPEMNFLQVIRKYGYPVWSKEVAQKVYTARRCPEGECARRFRKCEHNEKFPQYSMEQYSWLLDAPFLIGNECCNIMKKKPTMRFEKKRNVKPFIGTMVEESRLRMQKWLQNGCNAFNIPRPRSAPLSFWTEQDILEYIYKNNLEIAEVYGDIVLDYETMGMIDGQVTLIEPKPIYKTTGATRTGCVFCLFGITQDKDKFLRLKELEPKKYNYVMNGGHFENGLWMPDKNGLGYKFVIDWLNENCPSGNLNIKY